MTRSVHGTSPYRPGDRGRWRAPGGRARSRGSSSRARSPSAFEFGEQFFAEAEETLPGAGEQPRDPLGLAGCGYLAFVQDHLGLHQSDDCLCDLVLEVEQLENRRDRCAGPDVVPACRLDQLRRHADAPRQPPRAPLERIAGAYLQGTDGAHVDRAVSANMVLRAITRIAAMRARSVLTSSVRASAKRSRTPDSRKLSNGRTAIEGISGSSPASPICPVGRRCGFAAVSRGPARDDQLAQCLGLLAGGDLEFVAEKLLAKLVLAKRQGDLADLPVSLHQQAVR